MSWLKLDPAKSSMSEPDFYRTAHNHYLDLFLPHVGSFDWDVAAFYQSLEEPPIYYFSPGAADLLLRFGKFPYEPCDRPEFDAVQLQVGSSLAYDTAWVELPDETRPYPKFDQELADAEAHYRDSVWGPGGECGPIEDDTEHHDWQTPRR
ncbi:hypothetical protein N7E02_04055 (plasmid) [Aliirhizobium terrae]|uniref:hypothetical protein n=1 Tax=Terrirhizobium terrae TaxID=2926709 RepID=UPI00257806A9|nr:hypothetical protein [Rhizobium sp. CC-CFT758]WJH38586.1 hypothetical protein N7E02_04055 [Rhizobium sp. CC-CFT758]